MHGIRKVFAAGTALAWLAVGFGSASAASGPVGDGWYPGYSGAQTSPGPVTGIAPGPGTYGAGGSAGGTQGAGGGRQPSSKVVFGDGWVPGHTASPQKVPGSPPSLQGSGSGSGVQGAGGSPSPGSGQGTTPGAGSGGATIPPAGSGGSGAPSGSGSPPAGQTTATVGAQAQQMLNLINSYRQAHGVGMLTANAVLMRLAQAKANDLATYHYFSHYSPRLGWPITQEQAAGYRATLMGGANLVEAGSIQRGFLLLTLSAPHRKNLLNPGYTQIGIGVASVPGGVVVSEYFSGPNV